VAFGVPLALSLSARVNAEVSTQAQAQADLVAATAADLLAPRSRPELSTLARTAGQSVHGRVLIVSATGGVLVDTAGPAQIGASYESRPEIESALAGRPTQVQRSSRTLGQQILATAVPIIHDGHTVGAVRVTQSVAAVHQAVRHVELELALTAVVVLAIGLLAGGVLAAQIGRPIGRLEAVARQVAQGDLSARARIEGSVEQRSLSQSFNDMTDRIVRLLDAQREFVADASHQLRTPLTGLRLRLEAALAMASNDGPVRELEAGMDEVDRLSHTVDELLLLSREGERRPAAARVDLGRIAHTALQRWLPEATRLGISLTARHAGVPGAVWAAQADLERALDALIDNALHYSRAGSAVVIVSRRDRIDVCDRGDGIADNERELVFERFHRGRAGGSGPPGHGLGLAIAREFAREWGGEVSLEPRAGGGTKACLSFERTAGAVRDRGTDFARA
jgi:signal transduction histidine kinase